MITQEIQLKSIRCRGKAGGAIVSGHLEQSDRHVVILSSKLLPDSTFIQKGQVWKFSGPVSVQSTTLANGFILSEKTIKAQKAEMLRPAGNNMIEYLANNPEFSGIGVVKARKLYAQFGLNLFQIIRNRDVDRLEQILTCEAASNLCKAAGKFEIAETLQFLDKIGIPPCMGHTVVKAYGNLSIAKIKEDPYRLISFCASWNLVDRFALSQMGIVKDSRLRLQSAIEEALYRCFDQGSTCVSIKKLEVVLFRLLQNKKLVSLALGIGETNGQYYRYENRYAPAGAYLMERYIASRITALSAENNADIGNGIGQILFNFEEREGIKLTSEQRDAVICCLTHSFSLILGGAGVGKTTVLKCIHAAITEIFSQPAIYQMALSGRAAQRITEATGHKSYTIAGFLRNVPRDSIKPHSWIIIDECSMVDVITVYKLFRLLPEQVRIIFVGDPYQLPPIGPGLVLRDLVQTNAPKTTLKQVKRQTAETGIPQIAATIREGSWPRLGADGFSNRYGVFFVPCDTSELTQKAIDLYGCLGGKGDSYETVILSAIRNGDGGVDAINLALQDWFRNGSVKVWYHDEEFGKIEFLKNGHSFRLGDLVMYRKNDYKRDLRNGSLGRITNIFSPKSPKAPVCEVVFDGVYYTLKANDLENLELSYCLTIHKAQGSQFKNVVIPVSSNKLLDRTLLYTATTRGVQKVVLVGDEEAARNSVDHISAYKRETGLKGIIMASGSLEAMEAEAK